MGWTLIKRLGEGGHAFVSLATASPSPDDDHIVTAMNLPPLVAVKSAPFSHYEPLQFERETLYSLHGCPEIIKCYGADACFDEQGGILYNVFLEYAAGGSLVDRIYSSEPLSEEEIKEYTRSILRGLRFIHSKGMVHCDIKPDNILLVEDDNTGAYIAKVADFGLAIQKEKAYHCEDCRGTVPYLAPETVLYGHHGCEVDIWALGCTVIEMLVRNPLRDINPDSGIKWDVVEEMARKEVDIPNWLSEDARDFLKKCLIIDPAMRWTADRLLKEHPFVSDADLSDSGFRGTTELSDHKRNAQSDDVDEEFYEQMRPMKLLKRYRDEDQSDDVDEDKYYEQMRPMKLLKKYREEELSDDVYPAFFKKSKMDSQVRKPEAAQESESLTFYM